MSKGSKTLVITSDGLGEMLESKFADMCTEIFSLVLMEGRVEGLARADPGAMTPIGASAINSYF